MQTLAQTRGKATFRYDEKWYKYRKHVVGDRGVLRLAEKRALGLVRMLLKQGFTGIKYWEYAEGVHGYPRGHVEVTW